MKIAIMSALGNEVLERCISSLLKTCPTANNDIHIIREREFREETLNAAIETIGGDDDILFVGDDIVFTPGWYEALEKYYDVGDIIGLSTLYPETDKVQDNGYDLVQIDDRINLEARNRGSRKTDIGPFGYRTCDTLCGCFLLVKNHVFDIVPSFSDDGKNRWGEFIFTYTAKRHDAKVAVLDHYIYHGGVSTKGNPDKKLSSISYQMEKEIWKAILKKYVDSNTIEIKYRQELADNLNNTISEAGNTLLYGAGTVSELLLKHLHGKPVTICSGLSEEQGMDFHGHQVFNYSDAAKGKYDLIVMTPLYVGGDLYKRYIAPGYSEEFDTPVIAITLNVEDNRYIYDGEKIV